MGEMLIMPTLDTVISHLAAARFLGMFFGLASVFTGIGEAFGNSLGGTLYSFSDGGETATPYLAYVGAGIAVWLGLQVLKQWAPLRAIQSPAPLLSEAPNIDSAAAHPNPIKDP
jgi:MFS family permease